MPYQDLSFDANEEDILQRGAPNRAEDLPNDGQPWRDEDGNLTYETYAEFEADLENIAKLEPGELARVIDGEPNYREKNVFWLAVASPTGPTARTLFEYNTQRVRNGQSAFVPPGAFQSGEYAGVPKYTANLSAAQQRPDSITSSTTGANGTTTTTTTTSGGAGTVTSSVVTPNATSTAGASSAVSSANNASPTAGTQPNTVTSDPVATRSTGNSYVYEPLRPGFDRYDFNRGKKIVNTEDGPSVPSSSSTAPPTAQPTPIDGGIAVGTTTGGPSLLRQRRDRERDPNRVGPQ